MTAKQKSGLQSIDGSYYVTLTDGNGSLAPASTANANGQATMANSAPVVIASNQTAVPVTLTSTTITGTVTTGSASPYPTGATAITSSATGTTGSTVATLAGTSGKTTYISGFTITADATAAIAGAATVAGTISGSLNYIQSVGTATAAQQLTQSFNPAIPASAANTAITVTSAAAGVGGNTAVTAWGYQL